MNTTAASDETLWSNPGVEKLHIEERRHIHIHIQYRDTNKTHSEPLQVEWGVGSELPPIDYVSSFPSRVEEILN